MNVTINGEARSFALPQTVGSVLDSLGVDRRRVAVELNLEIVPRSNYCATDVDDGDRIEIVHFIGGGAHDVAGPDPVPMNDDWDIAGVRYKSRLLVGTGKYKDFEETARAIEASGAEIVTVAIRRVNVSNPSEPMLVDFVDPKKYTYLPNTAGCFTANDAVRTLRLARDAGGWNLVKLEVLGDEKTLYPSMPETLEAAELLIKEDFKVMV